MLSFFVHEDVLIYNHTVNLSDTWHQADFPIIYFFGWGANNMLLKNHIFKIQCKEGRTEM